MRFIVFGAGAVGGVLGARLLQHGHDVVFIARGAQYSAIQEHGLRVESPEGETLVRPQAVAHPDRIQWSDEDVVLLTVKTQDVGKAIEDLYLTAPAGIAVVCLQNGVESERIALRWFFHVYGVCVMCPTTYLTPGVVRAAWAPMTGILDIGCYPHGVDDRAAAIAAALQTATFFCDPQPDIMRWKYGKLLMSVGNSLGAICGPSARSGSVAAMARNEAIACFNAAGIRYVSDEEDAARRSALPRPAPGTREEPRGGSSWQSLQRQTATIEAGYLNGEIALLGRQYGIPTPVNVLLQSLVTRMSRERKLPGIMSPDDVMTLVRSVL